MIQDLTKGKKIKVAISHGDINGISYEVIIKALKDKRILEMFTPVIYGLSKTLAYYRKNLNFNDFNYKIINDAQYAFNQKVNIVNLSNEEIKIECGKSTEIAGNFAYRALEAAIKDIKEDKVQVLVTAPLNKSNIQSSEFEFPGHTEYLAHKFESRSALMLMVHDNLRVGTVTGHIPIKLVSESITEDLVFEKIAVLNDSLIKDFGIEKPKIAVLSLNPHAGDKGVIGDEDQQIVSPALVRSQEKGILSYGPFAADGFFGSDTYRKYDAILAMYHDQGLIPFKTLAFEGGVNFTAGLTVVRTSPAHGTAYDKAGKNISSCSAMREALYLAIDIYKKREKYNEMTKDPLPSGLMMDYNNGRNNREPEELQHAQD